METIKTVVLQGSAVVLALLILASLLRAVLGPRFTDRIIAVNVISSRMMIRQMTRMAAAVRILLAESVPKALPSADEIFVVIKRLLFQKQRCARHQPACSRQMAIPTGIRICKIKIAGIP